MEHAIHVDGLVKRFGDKAALDGVDLQVGSGILLGLLGPNGAGKTTMVRVLATLLKPDGGKATVYGHDVVRDAHKVRQLIGVTGQYASVDANLTGVDNLLLIGRLLGLSGREAKRQTDELLTRFDLHDAAGRQVKTYSGGMRRRLDLALSLVGNPRLLYLDEPTTGLDLPSRLKLWEMVRALVADGVTVLLTTQYLEEADALANEIVVIDQGKVIATGSPDELKSRIGAQRLEVKPVRPLDVPRVAEVVEAIVGREPDVQGQLVTALAADAQTLQTAVQRLREADVDIAELSLRGSSLDEVFLALTGHRAEESTEAVQDGAPQEVSA
ncbi:daunorubicin resistance protein DrrA family ABC transporter ATP-binding protein [Actinomadura kijaniata]|uniref:Oleandomycin transport system ATP-binding protein n=1 Tax=Actinomadura namibiensis TaxID=182080 RepID=A0A7W3QN03_ACTNM|nr:ATP-binding cassette domain-containing protein [Actinomadura namibiensis]MBA8953051.1 oleandomycin transport system ATP-binding protein [Actinomadura namibiensis]